MKDLLILVCCVSLALPPTARGDVADEFKGYVDQLIPLTYQMAENGAHHQESKVFLERISVAQSTVARMSEAANNLGLLLPRLEPLPKEFCPRLGGQADIARTVDQLNATAQAVEYAAGLEKALTDYRLIREGFTKTCEDAAAFDVYRLSELRAQVGYTPEVGVLDNVYVEIGLAAGVGGGAAATWGLSVVAPYVAIAFFAISIWQVFENVRQQERITEDAQRLDRERAKDEHYRKYASEGCTKHKDTFTPYFFELDRMAEASAKLSTTLEVSRLQERRKGLLGCLHSFENEYRAYIEAIAGDRIARERASENEAAEAMAWAIRVSPDVLKGLRRLDEASCNDGWGIAELVRDDLAALRLKATDDRTRTAFLPEQNRRLAQWDKKCGAMP